jgi:hypothetical protein
MRNWINICEATDFDIGAFLQRFDNTEDHENGTCGYCGVFALVLSRFLTKRDIENEIYVAYDSSEPIETPSWVHFFVSAQGRYWDVTGEFDPELDRIKEWYGYDRYKPISEADTLSLLRKMGRYAHSPRHQKQWSKKMDEAAWNTEKWWEPDLDGDDHPETGYQYWQRHGVPKETESRYSNGQCTWLALAMAERFGWKIRAEMMTAMPDHIAHAYCVMPNGKEIDILGPQDEVDSFEGGPKRDFTVDEMREWLKASDRAAMDPDSFEDNMNDARKAIDLFIASKVTDQQS